MKKGSQDPSSVMQPLTEGDLNKQQRAKTANSAMRGGGTPNKGTTPRVSSSRAGGKASDLDLYN